MPNTYPKPVDVTKENAAVSPTAPKVPAPKPVDVTRESANKHA